MKSLKVLVFFSIFFCYPLSLFSAGEEVWYTNKTLNLSRGNAFEDFINLFPEIANDPDKGVAGVREIQVEFAYDEESGQTKMNNLSMIYAGQSNFDRFDVTVVGNIPDIAMRTLNFIFGEEGTVQDPRPSVRKPVFVRREEVFLSDKAGQVELGTDSFVFDKNNDPQETQRLIRILNQKLNLGVDPTVEGVSDYQIIMTTKGTGKYKRLVDLKFQKGEENPKVLKGSDVYNALKSGNAAGDLARTLWHESYKKDSDLSLQKKNWPSKFSIQYIISKNQQNYTIDSIKVSGIKRGRNPIIYKNTQMGELETKSGADFNGIAKNIIVKTGLDGDVVARLTNTYSVALIPPENTNEYDNVVANSYSLVSYVSMNIYAKNADEDLEKTVTDVGEDYNQFLEEDALWQKYFNLNSNYWVPSSDVTIKGSEYKPNFFQLGYDNISTSANLKNHYLTVGTCLGQEDLNYPFFWSGSQAVYMNWKFSKGMRDITKLIDEFSIYYRSYNGLSNEVINELEQAVDNKYFNRNDHINRRIAIGNLEIIFNKTLYFREANKLKIPQVDNILISVPFQLPISYRDTRNVGGDNNITGAASYNPHYTYIKSYTGFSMKINFDRETDLELGNYYVRNIGFSYFNLKEQKNNVIDNGIFYSGFQNSNGVWEFNEDKPDDLALYYVETQFGYPDKETGIDKFVLKGRVGLGDRWSFLLTSNIKIAGSLWIDAKFALYETNSFAYSKVFMAGPVFRINY